eukprot:RCo048159
MSQRCTFPSERSKNSGWLLAVACGNIDRLLELQQLQLSACASFRKIPARLRGNATLREVIDLRMCNEVGQNAVSVAAENGHLEMLKFLRKSGVSGSALDHHGQSSAHWAAHNGHTAILQYLKEKYADLDLLSLKSKAGWTPLHCAAVQGHLDIVRLLVEEWDVDPGILTATGRSSLSLAAEAGHLRTVEVLYELWLPPDKGRDVDEDGCTPLHYAARMNHTAVVQLLCKQGFSVDDRDKWGNTALHLASRWGCVKAVEALLKKDANPLLMNHMRMTPLQCAKERGFEKLVAETLARPKPKAKPKPQQQQQQPMYP